jgi:MFS family permease
VKAERNGSGSGLSARSPAPVPVGGAYARYALGLLTVVYVFNFLDRQILSILAERIKADLGLTDAQLGFLYGTAFAVFYALFGIPLGRLADVWVRTRLIAFGLAGWSLMTAASALARNFSQLTLARIGVGVGEASASPAAYSLLADYFAPAQRASVLALYSSGIYIGAGLGLGIGGLIVDRWDAAFPIGTAPLGLRGWQVAFLAVGLPGVPLALWVHTLREPLRGQSEGVTEQLVHADPLRELARELRAVIPPFGLLQLIAERAGPRAIRINVSTAAAATVGALAMMRWLGTPAQWIALGVGVYATVSWAQLLARRDPAAFAAIFHTPTLRYASVGFALLAFTGYGVGFWVPPFFIRLHGVSEAGAGLILGGTAAAAGWIGVALGGWWADRWRRSSACARLYVGVSAALIPLPFLIGMVWAPQTWLAYAFNVPLGIATSMWIGPGASTVQDLTAPRMRATASAAYLLVITFVGLAMGPYTIGRVSVAAGDLRVAMLVAVAVNLLAALLLLAAARHLVADEAARRHPAKDLQPRMNTDEHE